MSPDAGLPQEMKGYAHSQLIGLQLSLNCPAACRSCAYDCGPRKSPVMSADRAISILEGLDDSYRPYLMPFFGFTGGEPLLYPDIVETVSRYVRKRFQFAITISTNCFWAESLQRATDILTPLRETGLAHLGISVDDFHQEHIDIDRVKTAITAASDMGITCYIQCAETRDSLKVMDYQSRVNLNSKTVRWGRTSCDPFGRAERTIPETALDLKWDPSRIGCCSILKTWIIGHDGRVTACCGPASYEVPQAGNVNDTQISDIINQGNVDPFYNALAIGGGPSMLIGLLAKNGITRFSNRFYTGPCHACGLIFRDREALSVITSELTPRRVELLCERLILRQKSQDQLKSQDPLFSF